MELRGEKGTWPALETLLPQGGGPGLFDRTQELEQS